MKNKNRLQPILLEIFISAVVGALIALICWGVLHRLFPEFTPWIAMIGVCSAVGFLSWLDLHGAIV